MRTDPGQRDSTTSVVHDAIARTVAIVGLGGIALIHVLDAPSKFSETPYMGWMYIGLIGSCVALAAALWRSSDARVWLATAILPVLVVAGFTLTRTTGLPQANGDIGNWTESLGLASLFVEASLFVLASTVVLSRGLVPSRTPAGGMLRAREAATGRSSAGGSF